MMTRTLLALSSLLLFACSSPDEKADAPAASASAEPPSGAVAPLVEYYVGEVSMHSPDGNVALGPARPTVAKRVLYFNEGRIEEWVWDEGTLGRTTMTRTEGNTFAVSEDQGRFTGKVVFEGEPWKWTKWSYDLVMTDGSGKLWGVGEKIDGGLHTNKKFLSPEGEVRVQIRDHLTLVDEGAFAARVKELEAAAAAMTKPDAPPAEQPPQPVPAAR